MVQGVTGWCKESYAFAVAVFPPVQHRTILPVYNNINIPELLFMLF